VDANLGTSAPEEDQENKKTPIPKEYDDNGHLIVKLSANGTATIRELNGQESCVADSYVGAVLNPFLIGKMYSLLSMQTLTIGGVVKRLPPALKNMTECMARAKLLTSREIAVLAEAYVDEYMPEPETPEEVKN